MMAKEEQRVPNLRFKGFTDYWEQHKLGDIAKVTKLAGFEFTKYINYSSKGKILAIRGLNIKDGKFNLQDVKYIDNSDFNKLTRSKLRQDDILFTYVGTIGNSAIVPAGVKWYLAPNVCLIRTQTENAKFISHLIQSDKFQHQEIPKWITTSSQPALSMENIRKFSIILPTISEQLKISNLVSIIDTLITLQQRKLDLLKQLKKGFLQKMFADKDSKRPVLRFKGFHDDWEQRKVSELADRYDNLRVPITASERVAGGTPYYGANGIQDYVEGFTHSGEFVLVAEDGANDLQNYPVQYVDGKVWVNNHAHVLQAKEERVDNKFLTNALKHINIEPYLVGGGRAKLNADVMMKINFKVPTLPEQVQIGKFFDNLDHLIALQHQKLAKYQSIKKSLLQQMFI